METFIPSLKKNIKTGRTDQARELLSNLPQRHDVEQEEVIQILSLAPDKTALDLLKFVTSDTFRDIAIFHRLVQLVIDRAHLNYEFILILFENADKKTVSGAIPLIRHVLTSATDKNILNSILRNAGKMKLSALTDDIAEFIFFDDPLLKREAVKALERIATPLSHEKLVRASETEKCDQDILDAIDVLKAKDREPHPDTAGPDAGKTVSRETLELLSAGDPRARFEGISQLLDDGGLTAEALADNFNSQDTDLLQNLLLAAGRTIPVESVNTLFGIINLEKLDNSIKFAAYNALSAFPELESAASILHGAYESAMHVRLAALKVLDKNLSDFVCAELKAKIESGTKKGEVLAQTILDAKTPKLIEALMVSDTFSYMASNYLTKSAPESALDAFISILEKRKLRSTAKKYKDIRNNKSLQEKEAFIVVSPAEATLDIYGKLINGCGFPVLTFLRSQDAFEAIVGEKPAAVICDMFLTDMTGLDFAAETRELYPPDQVPIIISTLQKTLDKQVLKKEMNTIGIKTVCDFPPKPAQIKSWLK